MRRALDGQQTVNSTAIQHDSWFVWQHLASISLIHTQPTHTDTVSCLANVPLCHYT